MGSPIRASRCCRKWPPTLGICTTWLPRRISSIQSRIPRHGSRMAGSVGYEIEHVSRYTCAAPAQSCVMRLCLKPIGDGRQRLLRFGIATDPVASLNAETDGFGNTKHVLNIHRQHSALTITASCASEVKATPPLPDALATNAGNWSAPSKMCSHTGTSLAPVLLQPLRRPWRRS